MSVSLRVPATSANVGPGYDAFALALGLYDVFTAELADAWSVESQGEGSDALSRGVDNAIARAMAEGFRAAGLADRCARIACRNDIPMGRGLGSSAAAIVGGLMLADALCDGALGRGLIFELASRLEGHSDNVAAALYGGFTLGWEQGGVPHAAPLAPAGGLAAVAVIADWELPTTQSRGMLPGSVTHEDAAFNAGRAGLVAAGIATGREELLAAGLADRLHEPYRAEAVHDFELVTSSLVAAGATGAVLSGAGPTVLGLVTGVDDEAAFARAQQVAATSAGPLSAIGSRRPPLALRVDRDGARRE